MEDVEGKQLIVNVTPAETRLALVFQGSVLEIFIERHHDQGIVGNIFKGVVTRVLPGMNSAFVDIGFDKSAFLFGGDVFDPEGVLSLPEDDEGQASPKRQSKRPIEQMLRDGQEIIVQVSKEPLGSKGPRVSMFLTLPGRYLVLMPLFSHIGISRRIDDENERLRLKSLVESLLPAGLGVIVRTAAMGCQAHHLEKDLQYLVQRWRKLEKAIAISRAPSLLYRDLDITQKVTRDLYSEDISKIVVDDGETFSQLEHFLDGSIPEAKEKLSLYQEKTPLFDLYGIEIDIGRALSKRVELPSGGYLIIEQTEALTTFDVNTGKFVGKANAQQTILKTNMEAAKKVVEQLRIRNIGGIIIVDFIDMESPGDRETVYHSLQEALKADRARTNVLRISELGLVQMTRKRTAESLERQLLTPCPLCEGRGQVRSTETETYDLLREVIRYHNQTGCQSLRVRVRKDIRDWLDGHGQAFLKQIERDYGVEVCFETSDFSWELLREPAYEVSSVERG